MEACVLDGFALVEQAHGDGHGIRGCQANDTNAGEGVKCSAGAEVDQPERDLYNHRQHHGVYWEVVGQRHLALNCMIGA